MNSFKIILIFIGCMGASIASTYFTMRFFNTSQVSSMESSSHLPPLNNNSSLPEDLPHSPHQVIPPPMAPGRTPNSVPDSEKSEAQEISAAIDFHSIPQEFDPNYDPRPSMTTQEALKFVGSKALHCKSDFSRLCQGKQFYIEHPLSCLRSFKEQLSSSCHSQLKQITDSFRRACNHDIERLCRKQARYQKCLKDNLQDLSRDCRISVLSYSR